MAITGVMKVTAVITGLKRAVKTGAMAPAMRLCITIAMAATATGMTVAVKPPDLKSLLRAGFFVGRLSPLISPEGLLAKARTVVQNGIVRHRLKRLALFSFA